MNSKAAKKSVVIADDHQFVIDGVERLLKKNNLVKVVGTCKSTVEAVSLYKKLKPDLLILDISFKDSSRKKNEDIFTGMDVLEEIIGFNEDAKVIMMSVEDFDVMQLRSIQSGAKGFVSKSRLNEDLNKTVEKVLDNKIVFRKDIRDLNKKISQKKGSDDRPTTLLERFSLLSPREIEVFTLMAKGLKEREIAEELDVVPGTVATLISRIKKKTELTVPAEITMFAVRNGIISV